ncbi:hypothetical protein F5B20DRAFT_584008 [Whalleya microplaca]|nr:hypothetical protein F5B20DRAFT_584008 [Whalleya microplaca]
MSPIAGQLCSILVPNSSQGTPNASSWALNITNEALCNEYKAANNSFCALNPAFVARFHNKCGPLLPEAGALDYTSLIAPASAVVLLVALAGYCVYIYYHPVKTPSQQWPGAIAGDEERCDISCRERGESFHLPKPVFREGLGLVERG